MKSDKKITYIAGNLSCEDWHKRKAELENGGSEDLWANTFQNYFMKRLELRYLKPIKAIQEKGELNGEGFSIVTIQCALIEFLAAVSAGKNYRFIRGRDKLGEHEYSGSRQIFAEFLISEAPFKDWFVSDAIATDFYTNVRCALLHEARTKDGWKIWASSGNAVDPIRKIVRRDDLQNAIDSYIKEYGKKLLKDKELQEAFKRKFDHLAAS